MSTTTVSNEPVAHLIRNAFGEVERVTVNDTDAEMTILEAQHVSASANVHELAEELPHGPPTNTWAMPTWRQTAPALKALADYLKEQPSPYDREPAMMPVNALDLPGEILDLRMATLVQIYHPTFDLGLLHSDVSAAPVIRGRHVLWSRPVEYQ